MYGSIFWHVTRKPRASRRHPIEAAASPLPSDDTTPPVTKMYFVATLASFRVGTRSIGGVRSRVDGERVPHPALGILAGVEPSGDLGCPQLRQEPPEQRARREAQRL